MLVVFCYLCIHELQTTGQFVIVIKQFIDIILCMMCLLAFPVHPDEGYNVKKE